VNPYEAMVVFFAIIGIYAHVEGNGDAADSLANRPIQHGEGLYRRLFVGGVATLVFFALIMTHTWTVLGSCALMALGMFNPVFRLTMNLKRGLAWWYMDDLDAGGNRYDEFFWKLWMGLHLLKPSAWPLMTIDDIDRRQVARMAYGVEIAIFAVGAYMYLKTV